MPRSDHVLPARVLLASEEVFQTTIDAPNLPRHRRRYGLTEVQGTRGDTGETQSAPFRSRHGETVHSPEKVPVRG